MQVTTCISVWCRAYVERLSELTLGGNGFLDVQEEVTHVSAESPICAKNTLLFS